MSKETINSVVILSGSNEKRKMQVEFDFGDTLTDLIDLLGLIKWKESIFTHKTLDELIHKHLKSVLKVNLQQAMRVWADEGLTDVEIAKKLDLYPGLAIILSGTERNNCHS